MNITAFEYRAIDPAGTSRRGVVQAISDAEAFRKVNALGLTPVSLRPTARSTDSAPKPARVGRVRSRDLAHFTYQLGVLVSSRIPLSEGLRSIAEQEKGLPLFPIVTDIAQRIESGQPIADAMAAHQRIFGDVYINTIRAAERSGNLQKALEHLSEVLERTQESIRQVRGALTYPVCVVTVLGLAVFFLVGFVIPKFATMFEQRNVPLPAFTRALMAFGLSVQSFWYLYLLAVVATGFGFFRLRSTRSGLAVIDSILHRIPYFRQLLMGLAISRFSRVLGLSISSGLGLLESLELAGSACGRPRLMQDVDRMTAQVRSGGRLCEVLADCSYFSPFTRRMLTAGEESAELPRMCGIIARHYEQECSHLAKNVSTIIEPVLIVMIAGVVLTVALAIFLPMWDMIKIVG